MELTSPKSKKLLIFQQVTCKALKTNRKTCSEILSDEEVIYFLVTFFTVYGFSLAFWH